jgi:hydroxycarboxylate dehydrogenase B
MPLVNAEEAELYISSLFRRLGTPEQDAQLVAHHLVEASLLGHDSHGIMRTVQYCAAIERGDLIPNAQPEVVHESPAGGVLDGRWAFGQVAAGEAMKLAMSKATQCGIGAATLRNCNHTGRLGAYTATAANAGMVAMMMVNAGGGYQSVVPFGGRERRLATNPLSFSAPSGGEFPLVLDIATSMAPEGKIRVYKQRNSSLPSGWIVDANGAPSTNPHDLYADPPGALLPFGGEVGHKGYGLALMVDVFAGALTGAGCCRAGDVVARDGALLVAIDVKHFSSVDVFSDQVRNLIAYVKSCPPAPGYDEVFVPGEMEYRTAQLRRTTGIRVEDEVWNGIEAIGVRLGVTSISLVRDQAATSAI